MIKVSIIVDGLEKQLNSLERQAKKAIRHRRLSSALGQLERSIALSEYKGLLDDRKVLATTYKESLQEEERAEQSLKRQWNMMFQAKQSLSAKQEKNNKLQEQVREITRELSETKAQFKYQSKEAEDIANRIVSLDDEKQRHQSLALQAQVRSTEARKSLEIADAQMKEAASSRALVVEEHEKIYKQIRDFDRQIDEYKTAIDRFFQERNKLKGEDVAVTQRLSDISQDLQHRRLEVGDIESQVQEKEKEQSKIEEQKKKAKQECKYAIIRAKVQQN